MPIVYLLRTCDKEDETKAWSDSVFDNLEDAEERAEELRIVGCVVEQYEFHLNVPKYLIEEVQEVINPNIKKGKKNIANYLLSCIQERREERRGKTKEKKRKRTKRSKMVNNYKIPKRKAYSVKEVAKILKAPKSKIYRLIYKEEIKSLKVDKSLIVTRENLEHFIRENKKQLMLNEL